MHVRCQDAGAQLAAAVDHHLDFRYFASHDQASVCVKAPLEQMNSIVITVYAHVHTCHDTYSFMAVSKSTQHHIMISAVHSYVVHYICIVSSM
jgi:hypothetical protein